MRMAAQPRLITARARTGTDPSEADLEVLDSQLAHDDALDVARAVRADTSDPDVLEAVIRQLERS